MIARDGAHVSLWQNVPIYESSNKPSNIVYDVAIVGGGITGISTALSLQRAGKSCIVFESQNLGFGTTGGTTAHINTLLDTPYTTIISNFGIEKAKQVARAAEDAITVIRETSREYRIECTFQEEPAFLFAQDEKQEKELGETFEACRKVGLEVEYVETIPVPLTFRKALKVTGQAQFHPIQYLHGIAQAFEQLGGVIVQQCRVNGMEVKDHIHIDTSLGAYQAKNLIYATHTPPGVNLIHTRMAPWRSYAIAIKLNGDYPTGLTYDMYDPYHYYRTQVIDGESFLIAGGNDHKTAHETNPANSFRKLESYVEKYFNVKEISFEWSSQYYETTDGLPYIGHLPGHSEHVFVATGFGGNGMTYSQVAARLFTALIVDGEKLYGDLFNPSRIKPVAGFKEFVKNNADVVKEFVGQFFGVEELESFAAVAKGEGKVVEYNGHTIGVSRDSDGGVHVINPKCTHMKCSVEWNNTEQSWDCPCHGARFDHDGKVLNGPADRDLEQVALQSLVEKH